VIRRGQRALRRVAPGLAAQLTWRAKLLRGDRELRLVERLTPAGGVALDVGANWGLFAHRLARLVGPHGRVHAFEPNPLHTATLARLASRTGNLTVHLKGASDRSGVARLSVPVHEGRAVSALASLSGEERGESVPVELTTLDAALALAESPIDLIKIDVEGHELPALRGAEAILRTSRPAVLVEIEERHRGSDVAGTFDYMLGLGYAGWCLRPEGISPLDGFDLERDQLAFTERGFSAYDMPEGYVNDFVFVDPALAEAEELDRAVRSQDVGPSPAAIER
jgi:FkbM family methyltransferase